MSDRLNYMGVTESSLTSKDSELCPTGMDCAAQKETELHC